MTTGKKSKRKRELGPILVVEDTEIIRDVMVRELRNAGYDAFGAIDGQDALDLIDSGSIKVPLFALISDLDMPRMCGDELIDEIESRPIECHLYTIVSSHLETHPSIQRLLTQTLQAPIHILPKPFSMEALLAILNNLESKKSYRDK
jgi:CheY-like chemotaxis protein